VGRVARARVDSIAEPRARARGAGSEFVLSCDMRFARRERAIRGQFEVGMGAVPGGNPMARLLGLHRSTLVAQQEQSARELNPFQLCVAPSGDLGLRKSRIGEASNRNADEARQELKSCAHRRTT
jgi:enoyl-CoA hydratase/carnithine racemase